MRITTWNVNGLRAVTGKGFFNSLEIIRPDVLCLQEVRARPEQLEPTARQLLNASFPYTVWNPAIRPGYSGVATMAAIPPQETWSGLAPMQRVRSPIASELLENLDAVEADSTTSGADSGSPGARIYDFEFFDAEGRVIVSRYPDFLLFNIYFPNGGRILERVPFKLDFYSCLLDLCDKLHAGGENVIICGDFNTSHRSIDLANPKSNEKNTGFLPEERAWIDRYLDQGFVDIYRHLYPDRVQYTWWTFISNARARNVGWRLDYFLISQALVDHVRDVIIHDDIPGSDHCPVTLVI